ncbi:hypothetical protein LXL04_038944 [Taraxacum kok-saghyz]
MEKGIFDIKLMNWPVAGYDDAKNRTDGGWFDNRTESIRVEVILDKEETRSNHVMEEELSTMKRSSVYIYKVIDNEEIIRQLFITKLNFYHHLALSHFVISLNSITLSNIVNWFSASTARDFYRFGFST